MPRETIRDKESSTVAEVTWGVDQYVQLATLSTDLSTFIAWCRELVDRYDKVTKAEKNPGSVEDTVLGHGLGMYWSPGRREINELIRILRRARNSAFGADE